MAAVLPVLIEMAANATFVAGFILGARVAIFCYRFLRRGF